MKDSASRATPKLAILRQTSVLGRLRKAYAHLRQHRFPQEFRIPNLDLVSEGGLGEEVSDPSPTSIANPGMQPTEELSENTQKLLSEIATSLWRLKRKIAASPGLAAPDRASMHHLQTAWDVLLAAGLEIRDHTGEPLPKSGIYALKRLAFQPQDGLTSEQVIETVKPSVVYRGRVIQMGEVIVGIPKSED